MLSELAHLKKVRLGQSALQSSYQLAVSENIEKKSTIDVDSVQTFKPDMFQEFECVEDQVPSDSENCDSQLIQDEKETVSSHQFTNFVKSAHNTGSLQQQLAFSSITAVDLSSSKLQNIFMANQGVSACFRTISAFVPMKFSTNDRLKFAESGQQVVGTDDIINVLQVISTLTEKSRDVRKMVLQEDAVRICLTLCRIPIQADYKSTTLIRVYALRLLAACLRDASARLYAKRIQASSVIQRLMKESKEDADIITCCQLCIWELFKSKRNRSYLLDQQTLIAQLIQLIAYPYQQINKQVLLQTGNNYLYAPRQDFTLECIIESLNIFSTIPNGRSQILQFNGLAPICALLKPKYTTQLIQKAVKIIANCAQDKGVDSAVRAANGLNDLSNLLKTVDFETQKAVTKTIVSICLTGPYQTSAETVVGDKFNFNEKNAENILKLVECESVQKLVSMIDCDDEVLFSENGQVIVQRVIDDKGRSILKDGQETRVLCLEATKALQTLIQCDTGRAAFNSQKKLVNAVVRHLTITDTEVLTLTLFCVKNGISHKEHTDKQAQELSKQIDAQNGVARLLSLLKHSDLQVRSAAAGALNSLFVNVNRVTRTARSLGGSFQNIAELLNKKMNGEKGYDELLDLEQRAWLLGVVSQLGQDKECAKVFSEFGVVKVAVNLLILQNEIQPKTAYEFYVQQLIKEKASLALAVLANIDDNGSFIADSGVIRVLVTNLQKPSGALYYNLEPAKDIGCQIQMPTDFGCQNNFLFPLKVFEMPIDLEYTQTNNPYFLTARATSQAMQTISMNRKCALLLRQFGASSGLLTLVGSHDDLSARSAAEALKNIRKAHIKSIEVFGQRIEAEQRISPDEVQETVRFVSVEQEQCISKHSSFVRSYIAKDGEDCEDNEEFLKRSKIKGILGASNNLMDVTAHIHSVIDFDTLGIKAIVKHEKKKEE
ncbi:Conserved_hypothetical protein [Hexamita inflata]|uniref:Uncharacterized protein n=1 Tax=Hexamita inflata TaxID=28002 RepID=A0AA86T943_9EUKA|nr:Conserved hypothetical protein [Hexamita inflata]